MLEAPAYPATSGNVPGQAQEQDLKLLKLLFGSPVVRGQVWIYVL